MTYPTHREADVALRDGSTVHVRPIRPDDEGRLLTLLASLSVDARVLRFFSAGVNLEAIATKDSHVDYEQTFGIVATTGADGRIVGHGAYAVTDGDRAEVGFTIAEDFQGRGLGTILLGHLAEVAATHGIYHFEAIVLPANYRMLGLFRDSGFPIQLHTDPNEIRVELPTSLTEEAIERFEHREQLAVVSAMTHFLRPTSVAVVGASKRKGTVGAAVLRNLLSAGLDGPVYPINPTAKVVQSVLSYPTVEDVPGPVDMAVIAVPSSLVLEVAEQCGRKGVRTLVVLTAGFGEVDGSGRDREKELLRICRANGMRMIGPNCIGVLNTTAGLNATFGPTMPPAGRVAFASQSGALGLAAIQEAKRRGIGISDFVSMGNKSDISGNDLLQYWESASETDVILLYLESFGNPRKFGRIARRVAQSKPIVAIKSGRSSAGARASASHTGALIAASDVTVDALFRQAGVIRADTIDSLFDIATLLAKQPVPMGGRVGIVTNVGGPAILCADTCEAEGLVVPPLSPETTAALKALLPAEASAVNPVDMLAAASADQYRQAIEMVAADPGIDAVVAIFIQPLSVQLEDVAREIRAASRNLAGKKPVLAVFMCADQVPGATADQVDVPIFSSPEPAAIALSRAARYGAWKAAPPIPASRPDDIRRDEAAALVATALGRGGGWLEPDEVAALLDCYGLPQAKQRVVSTIQEAAQTADEFGVPIALKGIAPGLLHKTDAGAVKLNLSGKDEVTETALAMSERLAAAGQAPTGYVVQQMVSGGVEMIVGLVQDPSFGPVLACGAGGVTAELIKDVSVRLLPLSEQDVSGMVRELRTYPLLNGYRGASKADVAALEDILRRLGALAEDVPQLAEMDCNPVKVLETGAYIVDARIRVTAVDAPRPLGARR
ncbi:MAG: GNAT family N-acetyltransferase [Chloroflexi bacterium]|nr:GNAT family N-acetyltransferase [Chloroflexota bacterium]